MRKVAAACLFLLPVSLLAQRFGGTPPTVQWSQINTDSARIIFPQGLDSQAQRIASIVHYQAAQSPAALGDKLRKINIVLQDQTIIPNGYAGLGPYRSEFYMTPAMNNFQQGSLPWADQLALHEYRHVQQFNNFHHGISDIMYYLFGEEGYALAINASIPDWFYEGDAVYNETLLSKQGRGRLPLFMNAYPSLWQSGKNYSWMKLRNGSLKDYVPNHYNLGYLLVNYGREKYGIDFWSKVTKDAAAFKGIFYPFQTAIKKHAGVSYETFRNDAFDYYESKTAAKADPAKPGPFPVFPLNRKVVTNYLFPYSIAADSLLYLRTKYNKRPAFFIKDDLRTYRIRIKDISIDDQFSYRNGKIVYAAFENDHRWGWRDYSVIRLLDIYTGRQEKITSKTRYFTPDISASGEKIVAVQVARDGKSELHILETSTGILKTRISAADISVFTDPKFISEDSLVCGVRLHDGKMALAIANLKSGSLVRLTPPSFNVTGFPCVDKGTIYFTASYGGNDDVFAIAPANPVVYRVTNGPLGNYFVNVANGKITWSSFTADGYQLQQRDEKDIVLTEVPLTAIDSTIIAYPVSFAVTVQPVLPGNLPLRNFPVKKYSKGTRLLNFHSWRPYYEDPEFSFSLYGENILNTLQTDIYYLYNENEKTHAAGFNAVYGQLFPYLSIGSRYTFGRRALAANNRVKQWDQTDTRLGINIPLSWNSGQTFNQFNAGTNYFYRKDFNKGFYKDSFTTLSFSYLHYYLRWGQQVEMAAQHIFPKWGYDLSFDYRHIITNYKSWQLLGRASVYLPGVFPSHSTVLTAAFQQTDTLNGAFVSGFPYSRGYNALFFPTVSKMWRLSGNYHLPLWYPDWGFANIFYLQRIRGNAFYDITKVYSLDKGATADQRTIGTEVYFDTKWWNQHPLTFGIRWNYLLDTDFYTGQKNVSVFEFILPVSIIPR